MTLEEEIANVILYWKIGESIPSKLRYLQTKLWYHGGGGTGKIIGGKSEHVIKAENLIKSRMAEALTSPYEELRIIAQSIMKEEDNK